MYISQAKGGKSTLNGGGAAVQLGGAAAAVGRTPPADTKRKTTPGTKKGSIQISKGLHWTDLETELLLDIIEEVQPIGFRFRLGTLVLILAMIP